jgi:hypothetical protein
MVNFSKLRVSTKSLLGALTVLGIVVQSKPAQTMIAAHPKLASAAGVITSILTLLHDPRVRNAFGLPPEQS